MNTLTQIAVPFHAHELLIVEHENQPYTPMRQIVEGMRLTWQSQHRKLTENTERWGVIKMMIPTLGDIQEAICLPLRKLFGWLMTISPNKIPNLETRAKVIMYQNECDDVLWDYWTKGQAINERKTISADDLKILEILMDDLAQGDIKIQKSLWRRFTKHFNIHYPQDLLSIHYLDAVRYIKQQEISHKTQQIPLLPMPFQQGRFLVVCDGEQLIIHDVADYDCIKKGTMQKFYADQKKIYQDLCSFITDPFLDSMRIKQKSDDLPVVGKLTRSL